MRSLALNAEHASQKFATRWIPSSTPPEIRIQLDRDSPGSHPVLKDMAPWAATWPRFQASHSLTQSMTISRTPGKARGTGVQEGSRREAGALKTLVWRLHTTTTPRNPPAPAGYRPPISCQMQGC